MSRQNPLRKQFPIFSESQQSEKLVYLDSAATTHLPHPVLDAIYNYYSTCHSNVHRGIHSLGNRATDAYESSRKAVAKFLNAATSDEIIFVRGTTEGINLIAHSYVKPILKPGDIILLTEMEHHSNLVPWQIIAQEKQAEIKYLKIDSEGNLMLDDLDELLKSAKILAISHVSNVLGTINPIKEIIQRAKIFGVPTIVDGAQAVAHLDVDVQDLDADFYVFSGHKIYSSMGIGVIYGKKKLLLEMLPYHGGGGMIERVDDTHSTYATVPHKFEAGTPNVAGAVSLEAGLSFYQTHSNKYDSAQLMSHAKEELSKLHGLKILGNPQAQAGVLSFIMDDIHPHDIAGILDSEDICIRAGHHCAMLLMKRFKLPATSRISFGLYNQIEDIEKLIRAIKIAQKIFQ